MVLKVLGNWSYKPEFAGNKNMEIVFKRLSARDELKIIEAEGDDSRVAMFEASIVEIRNPIQLDDGDKVRDMKPQDIASIGELKPLFYELLKEYTKRTAASEANVKKS
jgi:hypothetical protein